MSQSALRAWFLSRHTDHDGWPRHTVRLLSVGVAMVALVATTGVPSGPIGKAIAADQWNPAPGCGNRTYTRIGFTNDSQWSLTIASGPEAGRTLRQAIEYGRNDWIGSEIMHWQGYHSALRNGGDTFTMRWKPSWYIGGGDAKTPCSPMTPEIAFNSSNIPKYQANYTRLRGVSTHEWGHAWGLGHSGRYDSHGGGAPSMSTCWGDMTEQAFVAQDDAAGIQYKTNPSGPYGAVTANPSFEESYRWWGFSSNVNGKSIKTPGQDSSRHYLRFGGATSSQTYIYSTTRLSRMTNPLAGDMFNSTYKGRANYKKATSSSSGSVLIQLRIRGVDYPGNNTYNAGCQIRNNVNQAGASLGSWVSLSVYGYPSSGWNYRTTPWYTATSYVNGTRTEGVDVRMYVFNRMTFGGGYVSVDVDRVRGLAKNL